MRNAIIALLIAITATPAAGYSLSNQVQDNTHRIEMLEANAPIIPVKAGPPPTPEQLEKRRAQEAKDAEFGRIERPLRAALKTKVTNCMNDAEGNYFKIQECRKIRTQGNLEIDHILYSH